MEEEVRAGEASSTHTLRFIKDSCSSYELNLCGFNVISTSPPPALLLPQLKNLPCRAEALV
jgi:hypothetical protein